MALDPAGGRAHAPAQGRGLTKVECAGAKSGVDRSQGLALVHCPGSLASGQQPPLWTSSVDGDAPWGRAGAELTLGPAYPPQIKWDAGGGCLGKGKRTGYARTPTAVTSTSEDNDGLWGARGRTWGGAASPCDVLGAATRSQAGEELREDPASPARLR